MKKHKTRSFINSEVRWIMFGKGKALPLKAGTLEIEDQADWQPGDAEVVQDLAALMICNAIDDFRIDHQKAKRYEIRNIIAHVNLFVHDVVSWLLGVWDTTKGELNAKRTFVRLLVQTMAEFVYDFKRAPYDFEHFFFQQKLGRG